MHEVVSRHGIVLEVLRRLGHGAQRSQRRHPRRIPSRLCGDPLASTDPLDAAAVVFVAFRMVAVIPAVGITATSGTGMQERRDGKSRLNSPTLQPHSPLSRLPPVLVRLSPGRPVSTGPPVSGVLSVRADISLGTHRAGHGTWASTAPSGVRTSTNGMNGSPESGGKVCAADRASSTFNPVNAASR